MLSNSKDFQLLYDENPNSSQSLPVFDFDAPIILVQRGILVHEQLLRFLIVLEHPF
jgi:hypothetical protein